MNWQEVFKRHLNSMKNLNIIIRSILRQRLNSGIIIVSLSVGLACFNLIIMFISRELNTDNFHAYKDRIFALKCDDPWVPGAKMYHCRFGSAEYMKKNFAAVEEFCSFNNSGSQKITVNNEEYFDQPLIIAASKNFFSFFSYKLITNNPETVLEADKSLAISEDLAKKYFGSAEAVGQIIKIFNRGKEEQLVVTGIFKKPIDNTQINFDMVRTIAEADSRCYVRLASKSDKDAVEKLMFLNKESIPIVSLGTPGSYYLEPFKLAYFDVTRGSVIESSRDKTDLWIALVIGLMIIGIASFNYLGLLNNRLVEKNKNYIIRRINGGSKLNLILDFLSENGIIIGVSFLFGIFLMQEILPFFNELTGSNITEDFIFQPKRILSLSVVVLFLLFLTFLFVLIKIKTTININALKAGNNLLFGRIHLPAFNIFQLTSSIALIICSIVIIKQINYISEKPIGLDKNVIEVKLPGQYSDKVTLFREELIKNSSISQVSVVNASPVLEHFLVLLEYEQDGTKKQYSPAGFSGDENYLATMGIELIEGSDFSDNLTSNINKCLINQSFAKLFADQDLIGKSVPGMNDKIIIGIVKDFNYSDLKSEVGPGFISYSDKGSHLMVKATANQSEKAREIIAEVWEKIIPDYPLNIESIGDRFDWFHRDNKNYIRLIGTCSIISLFLSMIGLFAVTYQSSRARTKEIGIRKIYGAKIIEILELLNRNFLSWVAISFTIASPVAWYVMHKWLQNYAFKTVFSWWVFPLAGIIILSIASLTVSLLSWRTAIRNPIEALRYE